MTFGMDAEIFFAYRKFFRTGFFSGVGDFRGVKFCFRAEIAVLAESDSFAGRKVAALAGFVFFAYIHFVSLGRCACGRACRKSQSIWSEIEKIPARIKTPGLNQACCSRKEFVSRKNNSCSSNGVLNLQSKQISRNARFFSDTKFSPRSCVATARNFFTRNNSCSSRDVLNFPRKIFFPTQIFPEAVCYSCKICGLFYITY